jgi:hypothetical protein
MNRTGNFVLMLVYVDEEWMDIGGNKYPSEGYIEAKEFSNDIDISKGLYGIMWGKTSHFVYEKMSKGYWIVVKTEVSNEIIKVDGFFNRYKFRRGNVLYAGDLKTAAKYIIDHKDIPEENFTEDGLWLQASEIAGSEEWFHEHEFSERFWEYFLRK